MSQTIKKVAVLGLGVAGAYFAHRVAGLVDDLVIAEPTPYYDFPCGEAIPKETLAIAPCLKKYIVRRIRRVMINVVRKERVFDYGEDVGYIIDKDGFVNDLRRKLMNRDDVKLIRRRMRVSEALRLADIVIDARGPFRPSSGRKCVVAVQGFAKNDIHHPDDAIYMYFDPKYFGYFWIFPSVGDHINVGFGALCRTTNVLAVFKEMLKKHGIERLVSYGGKKIAINDPRGSYEARVLRIGEAGGFIVPFTGEGIRPALESAVAAANAVIKDRNEREVWRLFRDSGIVWVYHKHHRLFDVLRLMGPTRAAKLLLTLSADELRQLLRGEFGIRFYFKALKSVM